MYENEAYRIGVNWKDIIVKIILVILFIILLLWLFPRNDLGVFYDSVYNNNINTMKDAAERYYTGSRLPSTVGESKSMTLKEMIDNKMLIRFTDKSKNYCDEKASGVQVTKNATDDYVLKVHLVCGDEDDYILETLSSNGGAQSNIINGNGSSNNNSNNGNGNNDGSSNNNGSEDESGSSTGSVAANSSDGMEIDYSRCGTDIKSVTPDCAIYGTKTLLYQHRKAVYYTKTTYSCRAGYVQNGTKCVKVVNGATTDAIPKYTSGSTITEDADRRPGESITEYAEPIKVAIGTTYYCEEGYTQNGAYCIKYAEVSEKPGDTTYVCKVEEGFHIDPTNDKKCLKEYTATWDKEADKYTCPNGGDLKGDICIINRDATPEVEYVCPSGYEKNGSSCYKVHDASINTTYKCPNGGTQNGTKCEITEEVTDHAEPSIAYDCITGSLTNDNKCKITDTRDATPETTTKCEAGTLTNGMCVGTETRDATPKTTYTCATGKLSSDHRCRNTATRDATPKTTYTCATGNLTSDHRCKSTATRDATPHYSHYCSTGSLTGDNQCKVTETRDATPHYSHYCSTGSLTGDNQCRVTETRDATPVPSGSGTTYRCPSGWDQNGAKCTRAVYKGSQTNTTYSCPSGWSQNGAKCTKDSYTASKSNTTYSCPSGWDQNGTKCAKVTYTASKSNTTYSCPSGWNQNGAKCTRTVNEKPKTDTTYKCPDGYAQNGAKCTKTTYDEPKPKTVYNCPAGWDKNGIMCTKKEKKVYDAIPEREYSCPNGEKLKDDKCIVETDLIKKTTYKCPDGYAQNGAKCTKEYKPTVEPGSGAWVCKNKEDKLVDKTCIIEVDATPEEGPSTPYCPPGYNLEDGKCIMVTNAKPVTEYRYTCPAGYSQSGEGDNMICSRVVPGDDTPYCRNPEATLVGDKCIINKGGEFSGYYCEDGSEPIGNKCMSKKTVVVDATPRKVTCVSYKYIWSKEAYIEGWEFTGKTKEEPVKPYTAYQK